MFVKFTIEVDGRKVSSVEREVSGSPAAMEEQIRQAQQRTGRIALEHALQELCEQTPAPQCCSHRMENRGFCPLTVHSTIGEIPLQRRKYRGRSCGRNLCPADAQVCCGRHHVTRPLAQRACQLATVEHFPRLPELLMSQHGVTLCHETLVELAHEVGSAVDRVRQAEARWSARSRSAPA